MEEDQNSQNKKNQFDSSYNPVNQNMFTTSGMPIPFAFTTPNNYTFTFPFNYNQPISNQQFPNLINNPFIYPNCFSMANNGQVPLNVNQNNKEESKTKNEEKVKKNKCKKYKRAKLDSSDDDIKQAKNHKVKINNKEDIIEVSDNENDDKQDDNKKDIYIYTDTQKRKYFYTYHKLSKNKEYYELRCRDRKCNGRAKYDLDKKDILVTQDCNLNYEEHNYY